MPLGQAPSGVDRREIEWQLAVSDLDSVRRWLNDHATLDALTIEHRAPYALRDIYLDTDDWRMFRSGYALRIRSTRNQREATLKSLTSARAGIADRREINEPVRGATPRSLAHSDGPVGRRVGAVIAGHALRVLFEVRTQRQPFAICAAVGNEPLGEVALDESLFRRRAGAPTATLLRVEVEAVGQRLQPLEQLVKHLQAQCALEPARESKYEFGLRSVGRLPVIGPPRTSVTVNASMYASDVARTRLRALLHNWFIHEPGARLGEEVGHLHDLRATARRIDDTLDLYRAHLPAALVRSRRKLKALLRVVGTVRNVDVQLSELERFARALQESDRVALAPLQRHLRAQREKAHARMLSALDSKSMRQGFDAFTATLARPSAASGRRTRVLAVTVTPALIGQRMRKLRATYRGLTDHATSQDYHALRREARSLRYALESVAAIYGKPAERLVRRLRRWQYDLGRYHDASIMAQVLLQFLSDPPQALSARTLFLMGRFAQCCDDTAADARGRAATSWRKVRRRWKALPPSLKHAHDQPRRQRADPGGDPDAHTIHADSTVTDFTASTKDVAAQTSTAPASHRRGADPP